MWPHIVELLWRKKAISHANRLTSYFIERNLKVKAQPNT
jgi:hypothetical protein